MIVKPGNKVGSVFGNPICKRPDAEVVTDSEVKLVAPTRGCEYPWTGNDEIFVSSKSSSVGVSDQVVADAQGGLLNKVDLLTEEVTLVVACLAFFRDVDKPEWVKLKLHSISLWLNGVEDSHEPDNPRSRRQRLSTSLLSTSIRPCCAVK